jgi:PD-(D/E)XK endonuclease
MKQLTRSQKGAAAEAAITAAVIQLGLTVLRPLCEGQRYDLVVDLEPRLLRVQCKHGRLLDGVLAVGLATNRCTPHGYVSTSYSAEEIDAVGVFSPELKRCFLIPIERASGRRAIHLRTSATRNNQSKRIQWADDFVLETMLLREQGISRRAIAQVN